MKRLFAFILSLPLFAGITAAEPSRQYRINVGDFSTLQVDHPIAVRYVCNPDSVGEAIFDATAEQASLLFFDNNGKGKLTVRRSPDAPASVKMPRLTIYSSGLSKIVNAGDSLVAADNITADKKLSAILIGNGRLAVHNVAAPKVDASIQSGNGQLIIDGNCTEATLRNVGVGTLSADRLHAVKVKATVVGTGDIGCDPTEALTVMGVGSGNVYYRNLPPTFKSRGVGIKHGQLPVD